MKNVLFLCVIGLLTVTSTSAYSAANIYVSPSGSDSNDCQASTTACKTINAGLRRVNPTLNDTATIFVDVGNFYAAPYAPDAGAPSQMDGRATMDVEGFSVGPSGSLSIVCSTQQISPRTLNSLDAGGLATASVIGGAGANYEFWVQPYIDGGWGGYAIDAGYAYLDGGVGVLKANALKGKYINVVSGRAGAAGGSVGVIVSNTQDTINYVAATDSTSVTGPNAASTYNIYSPASNIYAWPVDGGSSTAYSYADLFVGGNTGPTSQLTQYVTLLTGQTPLGDDSKIQVLYCDFKGAPEESLASYDTVAVSSSNSPRLYADTIEASNTDWGVEEFNSNLRLQSSYLYGAGTAGSAVFGQNSNGTLVSDFFDTWGTGSYSPLGFVNSTIQLAQDEARFTDGATPIKFDNGAYGVMTGVYIDQMNNSVQPIVQSLHGSNLYINGAQFVSDGGPGFVSCGAGGNTALVSAGMADAGDSLISTDNAASWVTGAAFLVLDGGNPTTHTTCNQGTGCCISSY